MNDSFDLLRECRGRMVVVDTNILVLWMVGRTEVNFIQKFKRTQQFDDSDFNLLAKTLKVFSSVATTPNILTEVSNLCGQMGEPARSLVFKTISEEIKLLGEHYLPSRDLTESEDFLPLGLTDTAIARLGTENRVILTDDWRAAGRLEARGAKVINFNHLRNYS